jgi:PAS domain S-box-containing protein
MSKISSKKKANETAVSALEGAADGVVSTDEQGRVTTWNTKFLNIWGLSEKLVSSRDIQKIREFIAQQLNDSGRYLARIAEIEASEGKSFDLLN